MNPPRVPVLMYHKVAPRPQATMVPGHYVDPDMFFRQVRALKRLGFTTMRMGDLWHGSMSRKPIVLSFDDGYENFYQHAFPILRAAGETATVFLVSELVGRENLWDSQKGDVPERLMNRDQIKECSRLGIEMGSHTLTHADLTAVDESEARRQIFDSKLQIESMTGEPAASFCYPYGRFSQETERLVREAGYRYACTVQGGWNSFGENPMELKRVNVRGDTSPLVLVYKLLRDARRKASRS